MREILFRGKLKISGEWAFSKCPTATMCCGAEKYDFIPGTVGQYTGMTDKNGKKIFEGDIIEWDELEWGSKYREAVTWDYSLLAMRKNDWGEWCEVIGNIHDNPDLLEGGAEDG